MGIFSRIGEIVNANISTMLDKAENPEKMVRLMIHEMEDTLTEVKSSAAEVIADRIRTRRRLGELERKVAEWQEKAELAVAKGRDDLARIALERKLEFSSALEQARVHLKHVEEMVRQYQADIARLEEKLASAYRRQKELLLKHKRAEQSRKVEQRLYQVNRQAFQRFEDYADRIDRVQAETEVETYGQATDVEQAFRDLEQEGDVEKELEALKKQRDKVSGEKA